MSKGDDERAIEAAAGTATTTTSCYSISDIHRYSKYLLTYQSHFKDYDTFHETIRVIPPHLISEELVFSMENLLEIFSVLLHILGLELRS